MWRDLVRAFLVGLTWSLCLGCASTTSLLARRFAREHGCPENRVLVHQVGGVSYIADGCGQRAEYVCSAFAGRDGSEQGCAESGVHPNASPELPKRTYINKEEPPR